MKLKKTIQIIALSAVASALFIGCGESSDSEPAAATVETGTFIDAPVQGLKYVTASQNGDTNENGEFKYVAGEEVEFFLGNLSLGKATAGALMTPYTLSGSNTQMATNIALILQNLDANRSDGILDISQLKDFNFSDFNLSATSTEMETKISNKLTAGDFDSYLNQSDKSLLNTAHVQAAMDNAIQTEETKLLSVDNLLNKQFEHIQCSNIFGCSSDATFTVNADTISGTDVYYGPFSFSYTKEASGNILHQVSSDWTDYTKIISVSETVVAICSNNDTLEKAQACTVATEYWVTPTTSAQFIATKNASMSNLLTAKTQITNFGDIQNKMFYQLTGYHGATGDVDYLAQKGMMITTSNKINRYFYWMLDVSYDLAEHLDTGSYNYDVSFTNNILNIDGVDTDGEILKVSNPVYKYNVSNYTLTAADLSGVSVFDEDKILNVLDANQSFTFSSGSMYCTLLWNECWLDKDAMDSLKNQIPVNLR